ncbi:MAG: nuclear transport factor 2 family protein [Flavisolibacter sp.]
MNSEESLLAFSRLWDEAMEGNDADLIGSFMDEDWVIIGTEGGITSKTDFLQHIRTGALTHHTMRSDLDRIRIYGDTSVITSRGTSAGHFQTQPFSLYEWSTNVFVRKNESWTCVLTMLTPAKEQ